MKNQINSDHRLQKRTIKINFLTKLLTTYSNIWSHFQFVSKNLMHRCKNCIVYPAKFGETVVLNGYTSCACCARSSFLRDLLLVSNSTSLSRRRSFWSFTSIACIEEKRRSWEREEKEEEGRRRRRREEEEEEEREKLTNEKCVRVQQSQTSCMARQSGWSLQRTFWSLLMERLRASACLVTELQSISTSTSFFMRRSRWDSARFLRKRGRREKGREDKVSREERRKKKGGDIHRHTE